MRLTYRTTAALFACALTACSDAPTGAPSAAAVASAPSLSLAGGTGATGQIASTFATGKCIDVVDVSRSSGAATQIWSCSGGANQQWTWQGDGTIRVYNGALCLDAAGGSGNNGDAVIVYTCTGAANQKWSASSAGEIKGVNGKCIDIKDVNSANGARLQLWTCSGGANQKWDNSGAVAGAPSTPSAPPPSTPSLPSGVSIYPGTNIQSVVNANPAGTTYILRAGTFNNQTVVPKAGDVYYGETGAVMNGGGSTQYAFRGRNNSGWVNNVTIRHIKITNYNPPYQDGAISGGSGPGNSTVNWVVDSNEVSYNSYFGIRIGDRMKVTNNNVHHNVVSNISGAAFAVLVENNEIAWGNYNRTGDNNFESGGTKFTSTDSLVVRGNYVHDNQGVGLWTDEGNIHVLMENNRIDHNACEGILHEKSYNAIFRNNYISANGWSDPRGNRWLWNAGIVVSGSPNVEIYGNTVLNNMNGITGVQQNRGSGPYGTYLVQNMYVHDNTITQQTPQGSGYADAAVGLVQDNGDNAVFTSRNNRFSHNTYYLHRIAANVSPGFEWQGWKTDAQWRAIPQDADGSFNRTAP